MNKITTILLTVILVAGTAPAIDLKINALKEYQTIEGFGAFGHLCNLNDSYIDMLINDLGLTILRSDNTDTDEPFSLWTSRLTKLKAKADAAGEPLRFIASTWSPPAHMKVSGSVNGTDPATNKLKPQHYADYANFIISYHKQLKQQTGIEYYGLSLQNEPEFAQPYWSCVYTGAEYRDLIKACVPLIKAQFPKLKIYGPETMLVGGNNYIVETLKNATANPLLDVIAYHGYLDGVNPSSTSTGASYWSKAGGLATIQKKSLWMTETSGYSENWSGAITLAQNIYQSLKYGKLSAWVWWSISGGGGVECLMRCEQPTERYFTSKNFYRYIRPGAVMIDINDSTASKSQVFAIAFNHKEKKTLTVVLLNTGSSSQQITITGEAIPSKLKIFTTSSSKQCRDEGEVSGNAPVTLDAGSVTTLVGQGYTPFTLEIEAPVQQHVRQLQTGTEMRVFTIDGKLLEHASGPSMSSRTGVVIVAGEDRNISARVFPGR
jgi:O-glycosyl hydrolase